MSYVMAEVRLVDAGHSADAGARSYDYKFRTRLEVNKEVNGNRWE